jgi:MOSC domain-containing protein YiiM
VATRRLAPRADPMAGDILMSAPRLVSIQVGLPTVRGVPGSDDPMAQPWTSGIVKEPVDGPIWLGRTNLSGDGQADLTNHGGPDKAVLSYAAGHYPGWRQELDRPDLPYGAFGENFTVDGLHEEIVCVGDTYALGDVLVQVSQPRAPCWKLARRWRMKELTALVERSGRTGWYLRVLREGEVRPGETLTLLERPYPEWTMTRASQVLRARTHDREAAGALASVELLATSWRTVLQQAAAER